MRRNGFDIGMILFVILLLLSRFRYGMSDPAEFFIDTLITLPGIVIGITFHEFGMRSPHTSWETGCPKIRGASHSIRWRTLISSVWYV